MNKIHDVFLVALFSMLAVDSDGECTRRLRINIDDNKELVEEFASMLFSKILTRKQILEEKLYKITWYDDFVEIHISETDKVEEGFKNYIEQCCNDEVVSYTSNTLTWKKQVENFEKSISKDCNKASVIVDTAEYLPVIAKAYYDKLLTVNYIRFEVNGANLADSAQPFCIYNDEEQELQFNPRFSNFFFKCSLNLSHYEQLKQELAKTRKATFIEPTDKRQTLKNLILQDMDKLVMKRGEGNCIALKDVCDIYNMHSKNRTVANNKSKVIQNYISDYRKFATKYTLARSLEIQGGEKAYYIEKVHKNIVK